MNNQIEPQELQLLAHAHGERDFYAARLQTILNLVSAKYGLSGTDNIDLSTGLITRAKPVIDIEVNDTNG